MFDAFSTSLSLKLQVGAFLSRVGRQSDPADLLLLLGDDVHGHQHIQRVVHASPNVLLVIGLEARYSILSTSPMLIDKGIRRYLAKGTKSNIN